MRRRAPPVEEVLPRGTRPAERVEVGDDVEKPATKGTGRARFGERVRRRAVDAFEGRQPLHAALCATIRAPPRSSRWMRALAATPARFQAATAASPIRRVSADS